MKAFEFNTIVENNSIVLPKSQVDTIEGKGVKVVILYAESNETNEFKQSGYSTPFHKKHTTAIGFRLEASRMVFFTTIKRFCLQRAQVSKVSLAHRGLGHCKCIAQSVVIENKDEIEVSKVSC